MNKYKHLFYRIAVMILHAIVNFLIISWLMNFDISGSWIGFFAFILVCLFLLSLFIIHLYFFFVFIKTKTI